MARSGYIPAFAVYSNRTRHASTGREILGQGHLKNAGIETELQQILDFTPELVAVFGPARERIYTNRAAREYLGISLEEWRTGREGSDIHPDDVKRLKGSASRAL